MKYIVIIFSILISINVFGQVRKKTPPPIENSDPKTNKFERVSNLNLSTRFKKYPFSVAAQVQLVSFKAKDYNPNEKPVYYNNTPKLDSTVWLSPFYQTKTLNLVEIDRLTDIFYNYGYKADNHFSEFGACYAPRNAILFLNDEGEVFDYVEICFQCQRMKYYKDKIEIPYDCDHKIRMIRDFFKVAGIKYGVVAEDKK